MKTALLEWRVAAPGDEPVLVAMMRRFYVEDAIAFDAARPLGALRTLLADPGLGEVLLWLAPDGEVVGYAVLTLCFSVEVGGHYVWLDGLYLEPAVRGHGWGHQALAHVEARVKALGFDLLRMEVSHHNKGAKQLYLEFGYCDDKCDLLSRRLSERCR
ncbi:GNAT family N-acetyltransferase [Xylella taiwanensis]|uniref:GCN5 family acetyltransferase n=1 Tax=Xylella taiwanensis TaxID=1444770 RepID=Z9JGK8_9GAMM|nr:GNAT family N-acetyltransferase [Xylella taiwanensis]AXI84251.1 GCN5 family acetyltransferase [Xylella taiwanensis]EWS77143.1 GCN5 family acetyltransferase [Xylella taiwanensis]MCD8457369.1 GNAT family N-acetyltransferase [Xylella taiwanensis]MCD8457527.1 GNAT family N-acetyltransferase [Xylella taiwanensis]MCD8461349.1 GNAT family N-acetyltransferase [Xylella taiwanensis]